MTTPRRLILCLAVVYIGVSGFNQISDNILAGHMWGAIFTTVGTIGMAFAIFDEIIKDVTK